MGPTTTPRTTAVVVRRAVSAAALAVAVLVVLAVPASAHAVVLEATPEPDALLTVAPGAVRLRFSEAVDTHAATFAVTRGAGQSVVPTAIRWEVGATVVVLS